MAEITRYVNTASTAGGDGTTNGTAGATRAYASLSEAEAAEQTDLTTTPDVLTIYCTGSTADTTVVTFDGWTTDATGYIVIEPNAGQEHGGAWNTGVYRISVGDAKPLTISEPYTRVTGLQVTNTTNSDNGNYVLEIPSNIGGCIVDSVLSWSNGTGGGQICFATNATGTRTGGDNIFVNCMAWHSDNSLTICYGFYVREGAVLYNCASYNANIAYRTRTPGTFVVTNCMEKGATTPFSLSGGLTLTYFGYDSGTDPGTNGVDLSVDTLAATWTDAANGDFHLVAGCAAEDAGIDLRSDPTYAVTVDFEGDSRSDTSPCLGPDEIVSAATASFPPLSRARFFAHLLNH